VTDRDAKSGKSRRRRDVALAVFASLTFFAFPQRFGDVVVDGGLWLGPLSVAALVYGIAGLTPRGAAIRGLGAGLLAHAAILHWIFVVTVRYGGAPAGAGVLAVLAVAMYPAAGTAAVCAGVAWLDARGRATPVLVAATFAVGDHLRTFVATGFPWSLLGYTQLEKPGLLPLSGDGGVYLVGFGVALGGALLAAAVAGLEGRPSWSRGVWTGLALFVGLHGIGLIAGSASPAEPGARVRVAALQGSFDQGEKWSRDRFDHTLDVYASLSRAAASAGAELIVWPETAVPAPIEVDPDTARRLSAIARETGATLVVGAVGVDLSADRREVVAFYDSAFVIEPDGRWASRYDKSHLVPFGEYVPFRALLGRFIGAIARGAATLDVSAGHGPVSLPVEVPDRVAAHERSVRLGIPICYELLFPDRVRRFVDDGAVLLVAITNDAWYGRTGAPHQFLEITAMRAVESGVALVRAANTGVSAIVDAKGRVREQSGLFERGYVMADVRLGERPGVAGSPFYVRHGNVFVMGCWLGLAGTIAIAWLGERRLGVASGHDRRTARTEERESSRTR